MGEQDAAAFQILTHNGLVQPRFIDFQQHQPRFTAIVFVRRSQYLRQFRTMNKSFGRKICAGKLTCLLCAQPIGAFGNSIEHDASFTRREKRV